MYTEEDLRRAFQAALERREYLESGESTPSTNILDEDEYIESLKDKKEELKTIPFTYFHLYSQLGWARFCDLTGTSIYARNEGYEIEYNEVFFISESDAKKFNLI